MSDSSWMRLALNLAERGRGWVEPNPLVGAVVVRDLEKVGEGWHQKFGAAHAEVNAFAQAGAKAHGATLYVTLEPCCHVGKTPPCTDAIIAAGIKRVVAAMGDPFPRVAGGGLAKLREAGIEVEVGLLEAEAQRLNAPYLTLLTRKRPYVHAKWAMTLDGKIATRTGESKWISGEASRRRVHELRGRMDAIIVGAGTVRADDPLLTARPPGPRVATRVVLTMSGSLPPERQLWRTAREVPVILAGPRIAEPAQWREHGCEVLMAGSIQELLAELGRRRFTNVLIEGGAGLLGSFHDEGLIDAVHVFVAPKLVGGAAALAPVAGAGLAQMAEAIDLENVTCETSGSDWYFQATVRR